MLPDSYSHIADSLLATNKINDLTVEGVQAKILETKFRHKGEIDPTANAIRHVSHPSISKKKGPKGACYNCGNTGHWANRCPVKKLDSAPAATSPLKKDLGQDVEAWGGKRNKPATGVGTAAINNVAVATSKFNSTIFFYDRADIAAEPWLMDSSATDHMTPWGSDFATYVPYKVSNNSIILGNGTTKLEIIGKGTV